MLDKNNFLDHKKDAAYNRFLENLPLDKIWRWGGGRVEWGDDGILILWSFIG